MTYHRMRSSENHNNRNRYIMTLERKIARAFSMDDATWMRHAKPITRDPSPHSTS